MDKPIRPNDSDCCNSGCNPCIFDVYEEQLKRYRNFTSNIEQHTSNTFLYKFRYVKPPSDANYEVKLSYNPGQHFLLKGTDPSPENGHFTRAYTPIPIDNDDLTFTVLIRLYENGKMSQILKNTDTNSETLWRGPYGNYNLDTTLKHLLLIAQGTGIAPMFSILTALLQNDECYTFLKLYFCCRNEDDILLRKELYRLLSHWNFTYEVFLAHDTDAKAKYNEVLHLKRLSSENIETYLEDKCKSDVQVLICGRDSFVDDIKHVALKCGVSSDRIFTF